MKRVMQNKLKVDNDESQDEAEVPKSKKNRSTASAPSKNTLVDNSSKIPGFQGVGCQ